jgi:2'-deoxymugineic-acid 2'-dioxygenase/mugineic-acid 3-dioxygenase
VLHARSVLTQVINHGIPEQVLQDVVSVIEEFFQLPAAD